MAAAVAAHLGLLVVTSLNLRTDSQIVLCWLKSQKKLHPYIDRRNTDLIINMAIFSNSL